MGSIYDMSDEKSLSEKDIAEIKEQAADYLRRRRKNALCVTVAFFLTCAVVTLFLAGFPLHAYWDSLGRYILLLTMGLLPVFVVYVGLLWSAWIYRRDIEREFRRN
jgi:hypothetical protein